MAGKIYSVAQVNKYIKNILTQDYLLKRISVRGEVSNCKYHSMGHIYFSVKDESGVLPCVMFQGSRAGLSFQLADGQSVVVSGSIGVYERDGRYQLIATEIRKEGIGNLYEQFERLKARLNEEGLFDPEHKKEIPPFPKRIGIVTAATGAAIQDIRQIAHRRNPYVELFLYPAKVQGEGAAETIARGIAVLDGMGLDTLIVGRGGGSMEDLWAFNEEIVVRAVYAARTPIISGVGHEVDLTLTDYVADRRAPTPSAACELAVPDVMKTLRELEALKRSIKMRMEAKTETCRLKLMALSAELAKQNPETVLQSRMQTLSTLYDRLRLAMERKYEKAGHKLALLTARLEGASPGAKLVNGFGYIEADGKPLQEVREVQSEDLLEITVRTGRLTARVQEVFPGEV